jgi:hypothetical protein
MMVIVVFLAHALVNANEILALGTVVLHVLTVVDAKNRVLILNFA